MDRAELTAAGRRVIAAALRSARAKTPRGPNYRARVYLLARLGLWQVRRAHLSIALGRREGGR